MFFPFGSPHICPVCTDFRFRRSTQGLFRYVAILVGLVPFRCLHCQTRVWRIAPFTKLPTKKRKGSGAVPRAAATPDARTPADGTELPTVSDKVEKLSGGR
jgi:hypothetical protein